MNVFPNFLESFTVSADSENLKDVPKSPNKATEKSSLALYEADLP